MSPEDPTQLTPSLAPDGLTDVSQALAHVVWVAIAAVGVWKDGAVEWRTRLPSRPKHSHGPLRKEQKSFTGFCRHRKTYQAFAFDPLDLMAAVNLAGLERDVLPEHG
jgi:hypothetical protein